jgi:hypothetical protein
MLSLIADWQLIMSLSRLAGWFFRERDGLFHRFQGHRAGSVPAGPVGCEKSGDSK